MDTVVAFVAGAVVAVALVKLFSGRAAPQPPRQKPAASAPTSAAAKGRFKMVLLVRTDLKMGTGKVAAQVGHATLGAYKRAVKRDPASVKGWTVGGQAKIALKCPTLEEMHALQTKAEELGLITYLVADAGKTQIEAGTETVCAIGPGPEDVVNQVASHLKLL